MGNILSLDKFKERFYKVEGSNEYEFYEDSYNGVTKKIKLKHITCGSIFYMIGKNFISSNQRCPECAQKQRNNALIKDLPTDINDKIKSLNFSIKTFQGISKKIEVQCNYCNYKHYTTIKLLNSKKKYLCPNCSIPKVFKISKNIDKYQERIENMGIRIIPEYFSSTLKLSKFECNDCGQFFTGYLNNFLTGSKKGCPHCIIRYGKDVDYYLNKLPEDYIFSKDSYINASTPIEFTHIKCGLKFNKTLTDFFSNNQHCPECAKDNLKKSIDDVNIISSEHGFTLSGEYINAKTPTDFICSNCNSNNYITLKSIYGGKLCNTCGISIRSKGEKLISDFLEEYNIEFITEKEFDDLYYIKKLRFDFYIEKYNLLIEFDGIQHFKEVDFFGGKEYLYNVQLRDSIKNNYCKEKNINLLRIPYYNLNNITKILKEQLLIESRMR